MTTAKPIPAVSFTTARTGASAKPNEMGMRQMQERAYAKRGEQYLLIKSPPASGKSRALMFIALDKLHNQGVKQAIIVVPEKSIGGSFADEPLSKFGFWADWAVKPQWNLCNAPGPDEERVDASKVRAVGQFLASDDRVLVCTHASFRFAVEQLGIDAFDNRLIAVDEFHHVSASADNKLGSQLGDFIHRDKVHLVAMTGSYFRGDAVPVLMPEDEAKFETVTYTYYEQLNGYEHLKSLNIGYFFYSGRYLGAIEAVLDPSRKTIVHIPSVNSRESTKDKIKEVEEIMEYLGDWKGADPVTGFHLVALPADENGNVRTIKIADLVDDSDQAKRAKVLAALKDPAHKNDRDHVDIIIALGMAKEGFDWIWCEHALTVGYRSSLTEIIQIIGRATRDAPGKEVASFTNLIAEPDASEATVVDAINDTLKAIAASLLMEQVLAPRFNFTPKNNGPIDDFDYGPGGYQEGQTNVGFNEDRGQFHFEIKGLVTPKSPEATRICAEDLNEVITAFVQDKSALERGLFDGAHVGGETLAEELTQLKMGKIVRDRYPELSGEDQEAVRQHAVAALNLTQKAKQLAGGSDAGADDLDDGEARSNTALIEGVRKFAIEVKDLDIDLIDRINPFEAAYSVLAKAMNEGTLKQVAAVIGKRKVSIPYDEARDLAVRALQWKKERGRAPEITSQDPWEKRLAEGVAALAKYRAQQAAQESANG
jgi:superfamily II DNA or RNA helicase